MDGKKIVNSTVIRSDGEKLVLDRLTIRRLARSERFAGAAKSTRRLS